MIVLETSRSDIFVAHDKNSFFLTKLIAISFLGLYLTNRQNILTGTEELRSTAQIFLP